MHKFTRKRGQYITAELNKKKFTKMHNSTNHKMMHWHQPERKGMLTSVSVVRQSRRGTVPSEGGK